MGYKNYKGKKWKIFRFHLFPLWIKKDPRKMGKWGIKEKNTWKIWIDSSTWGDSFPLWALVTWGECLECPNISRSFLESLIKGSEGTWVVWSWGRLWAKDFEQFCASLFVAQSIFADIAKGIRKVSFLVRGVPLKGRQMSMGVPLELSMLEGLRWSSPFRGNVI